MGDRLAPHVPSIGGLIFLGVSYAIVSTFEICCVFVPKRVQSWQLRLRERHPFLASFDPSVGFMRHPLYPAFLRATGIVFIVLSMVAFWLLVHDYCAGADNLLRQIVGDRCKFIAC